MRFRDFGHYSCGGYFLHPQLISCHITEFNANYESPISDPDPKRQSVILIVATIINSDHWVFAAVEDTASNEAEETYKKWQQAGPVVG